MPSDGEPFDVSVPGTITVRDVTQDVTVELQGQRKDEGLVVENQQRLRRGDQIDVHGDLGPRDGEDGQARAGLLLVGLAPAAPLVLVEGPQGVLEGADARLGVGHETEHPAGGIAESRHAAGAAVRIGGELFGRGAVGGDEQPRLIVVEAHLARFVLGLVEAEDDGLDGHQLVEGEGHHAPLLDHGRPLTGRLIISNHRGRPELPLPRRLSRYPAEVTRRDTHLV